MRPPVKTSSTSPGTAFPAGEEAAIHRPAADSLRMAGARSRRWLCYAVSMSSQTNPIAQRVAEVNRRMNEALVAAGREKGAARLVAVSKKKSLADIRLAYDAGLRHFGENYLQELVSKANEASEDPTLQDIRWHFVGRIQGSRKAKDLGSKVPNLCMVETIENRSCAEALDSAWAGYQATLSPQPQVTQALPVLIQVNTSGESNKGGLDKVEDVIQLAKFIRDSLPWLDFAGLMTIGAIEDPTKESFRRLIEARASVEHSLGLKSASLELSMGMSFDFEKAISLGSTSVRVGTDIFGPRD